MSNVITNTPLTMIPPLIVIGEKHGRRTAVGLGDNPEFQAIAVVIYGKEAASRGKRPLIFRAVFGADIATIALRVARKRGRNVLKRKPQQRLGGHGDCAKRKLRPNA